eukprot:TRINITY_DN15535_c0_g2_i4.p1 TRINITY_DN15535_c0_g2~~TRINITY_DN15535_c0_g2_i4.p1  ORF type:complete len:2153 (+),score=331.95 TRINITY_DN15535_c0_g2_i4:49-6507(+)
MGDGLGRRVTNLYFEAFEGKARGVLVAAAKYEDDERVVAHAMDTKELRGPLENLENFAVMNKTYVDPTVGALVGWRGKMKDDSYLKDRIELAGDTVLVRACTQILLHNDTWQNHWADRRDIGLTAVTDTVIGDLRTLLTNRVRFWSLEAAHPVTEGRRRACEMMLELLGQLSRHRFSLVTKQATDEITRHLSKAEVLQGKVAEREVLLGLKLLKYSRPPIPGGTDSQTATRLEFFKLMLTITQKIHKNKGLKRSLCEILTSSTAPLATSTTAARYSEVFGTLYEMVERWAKKPKHVPAAVPLQTTLLCVLRDTSKEKVQMHLDLMIKRLTEDKPDKERSLRCMHLESLLHVLGYFLTRYSGEALPSVALRYIPPPPEDSRSGHSHRKENDRDKDKKRESPIPSFSSEVTSKVVRALCNIGRKQLISQLGLRSYALSVDVVVLMCRTRTTEGINAITALIPSYADAKEVYSENTLVGLYSLLAVTQLAQHYQPQGAVEEPGGISQGIQLPWWSLGTPNGRGSSTLPVRLRSPFTSFRPPSPAAAITWPLDKCTAPALSGLWAAGLHLTLDTSTLCSFSLIPPHSFTAKLQQHAEELSQRVSVCLSVCEKELCPSSKVGRKLGWTETSEKERPSIHIFRIALLSSICITPSEYTGADYYAMLARLTVHPQPELRDTVCYTVLPQLLVQRLSATIPILNALADLLLGNLCDTVALQVLHTLIRLLGLLGILSDPLKQSAPAPSIPIYNMVRKPLSVVGAFADQCFESEERTWAKLEAGCLVFLATPNVEIKGKALAVLHWIAKIAPPLEHKRVATVLDAEIEEIEAAVVAMLTDARASGADWSESKEHKRVNGLLPLQLGDVVGDIMPHENHELPECLRTDDLPPTALTRMVLYSCVWPYCLGVASEVLSSQCPKVPALACKTLSAKFPTMLHRFAEQKGELTSEDRRSIELYQGYAVICIAGCELQPEILQHVISMLKSPFQDLADVAAVGLTLVPRQAVPYVVEQLRGIDEEVRILNRKDKNRRQVWLQRGHIIKAYSKALQRSYSNDWVDISTINKIADWVDEQLELLLTIQADRLLYFDQLTILRCRADLLEAITIVSSLFHQHGNNRCMHLVDPSRRRKWLAFGIHHSKPKSMSTRSRTGREESPVFNNEVEFLLDTARKRGRLAVRSLLCGPILVQPDMEWVEDCAAGSLSHRAFGTDNLRDVTFSGLMTFIHSLLPCEGTPDHSSSYRISMDQAKGCMAALLKCNQSCPGLLRVSAALALHKDYTIAKLHMCVLANAVSMGCMPPTPTIPWVLAAVVCSLPSHDQVLQDASWKLLPFICPLLDTREFDLSTRSPTEVIHSAACLLPEAGAVLVSLAKERLPLFSTPRRVALLLALVHWATFLKLDTPSDVDELLVLTELYTPSHPDVLQELWRNLNTFDSIVARVQERCITSLTCESLPSKACQLCDTVISLMPQSAMKCVIAKIEDLLQPDAQYPHRAVAGLILTATVVNVVDTITLVELVPCILHALVVVGCNHPNAHITQRCRSLLVDLLPAGNTDTRVHKTRERLKDLLSLWEDQPFSIEGNVLNLVLMAKPLHTSVQKPWMHFALKCLCSEAPSAVKIQSLELYVSLTKGECDLTHGQVLLQSLVISVVSKNYELVVKLCCTLEPLLMEYAKRGIGIPAIWGVITLIKCKDTPIPQAAAAVGSACLAHMKKLPPDNPAQRVYVLLRATLSQLYVVPNHNELVKLLVTLTSCMPEWLPTSTVSSYQCIVVAALLPEICVRMSVQSASRDILSLLATSCKGSLGQVLRPRGTTTDMLHRVTEALAERLWGGSEIRDTEIGEFYHHLLKSEQILQEGILPWVLRTVAHFLSSPAIARIGVSGSSFSPLLGILPTLTAGPAHSHAARCLSLAVLRDKGTSGKAVQPRPTSSSLLLTQEECSVKGNAALLAPFINVKIAPPEQHVAVQLRSFDGNAELTSIEEDLYPVPGRAYLRDDVTEPCSGSLGTVGGRFNFYDDECDVECVTQLSKSSSSQQNMLDSDSEESASDSDQSASSFVFTPAKQSDTVHMEKLALESRHVISAVIVKESKTLALVAPASDRHTPEQILSSINDTLATHYTDRVDNVHLCGPWTYPNGLLLNTHTNDPRRLAVLYRFRSVVNNYFLELK